MSRDLSWNIDTDVPGVFDLVHVDNNGTNIPTIDETVRVANVEGHSGLDQGVKATSGAWVKVEDSWFHNNYRGGLQATFFPGKTAGKITANRNMVEKAGLRYLNGNQPRHRTTT